MNRLNLGFGETLTMPERRWVVSIPGTVELNFSMNDAFEGKRGGGGDCIVK